MFDRNPDNILGYDNGRSEDRLAPELKKRSFQRSSTYFALRHIIFNSSETLVSINIEAKMLTEFRPIYALPQRDLHR